MKEEISISYESLWKFIIRPPRDRYSEELLGPQAFYFNNKNYLRKDYDLLSSQGYKMKCSFIEPDDPFRDTYTMPVIIYLHGNSSSRLEGLRMTEELLKRNINLFLVDLPGCGLSGGEFLSLGFHEKEDVGVIVDFLEKIPGVGKIGLWGRSMGAATTMLYAHKDPRVNAICVDSPFAEFRRLAKELTLSKVTLPNFLIDAVLGIVRRTIIGKNGLDINLLNPIDMAKKTLQPALFVHAKNDDLISLQHSVDLFDAYKGVDKFIVFIEKGGHNTRRPDNIINQIGEFFEKYLIGKNEDKVYEFEGKNEENKNNINSINQSNEINSKMMAVIDEHIEKVERKDKKQMEEVKSCLMKIKSNDIKK